MLRQDAELFGVIPQEEKQVARMWRIKSEIRRISPDKWRKLNEKKRKTV